ncbi:MAG: M48 family metallopeptidase [Betaproteobacteria bacterium]|nr:M48 family metallopeptidase [Betaproteobacteria bacterium]
MSLFGEPPRGGGRGLLHLAGRGVEYRLTRARRRTIGIRIDADGLALGAPLRAPWSQVEAFVRSKERWIIAKLDQWASAPTPRVLRGVEGEALPLFGEPHAIALRIAPRGVRVENGRLVVSLRSPGRRASVLALLQHWLKERALESFAPRVAHYALRLDLPAPSLALSNARRQWGVCVRRGGNGHIRLNWRLVQLPPALADYVVAHEAAHLVEMNHSPRFWTIVGTLYPDWRAARQRLRLAGATLPHFGEPR